MYKYTKGDVKAMKTNERLELIKTLVKEEMIEDQATLVDLLNKEYQVKTNQVQVSRDLRRLDINKRKVGDKIVYDLPETDTILEILRLAIVEVTHNESMIVVKTIPAQADFVGDYLDAQEELDILGTLAGENTLLIPPKTVKDIKNIHKQVCKALYYKVSQSWNTSQYYFSYFAP